MEKFLKININHFRGIQNSHEETGATEKFKLCINTSFKSLCFVSFYVNSVSVKESGVKKNETKMLEVLWQVSEGTDPKSLARGLRTLLSA